MTTQLTLISLPEPVEDPAEPTVPAPSPAVPTDISTDVPTDGSVHRLPRPSTSPAPVPDRSGRRSAGHTGWLDGRTITTGRKGVAAARAALADATRRAAEKATAAEADRDAELHRWAVRGGGRDRAA